jgi:hypothetical protein
MPESTPSWFQDTGMRQTRSKALIPKLVAGFKDLDILFPSYWECHHPN